MKIEIVKLPYAEDALAPVISKETISYHYGKHLPNYVNTLASLVKGTPDERLSVEEIVKKSSSGKVYNNAGQVLNHTLYFLQFAPKNEAKQQPEGKLLQAIESAFGSFGKFKEDMDNASTTLFGSGWAWLVSDSSGKLGIKQYPNGGNPLSDDLSPLLGFDVWEHAYYLDFQNRRADHIKALWEIINWKEVENRYNA